MEVRRVLQLLLRHIEYCHIRITLARLRSGRIGFDGRRGGCATGGGRRCHRRGLGNHSSFSPPMHRLERNSHGLLANAKEPANPDNDGLSAAVMIDKYLLDSADTLLQRP